MPGVLNKKGNTKKRVLNYIANITFTEKSYSLILIALLILSILDNYFSIELASQGCIVVDAIRFKQNDNMKQLQKLVGILIVHYFTSAYRLFLCGYLEQKYERAYMNDAVKVTLNIENDKFHSSGTGKIQEHIIQGSRSLADGTVTLLVLLPDLLIFWLNLTYKLFGMFNFFTTIILVTGLSFSSTIGYLIGKYIDRKEVANQAMFNSKIYLLTDILNNYDIIKSYNKETIEAEKYRKSLKNVTRQTNHYFAMREFLKVIQKLSTIFPHFLVLYFIITDLNRSGFDIQLIAIYNSYYMKYRSNFTNIRDQIFYSIKKIAYGEYTILNKETNIHKSNKINIVTFKDEIKLNNCKLYAGNTIIQNNLNININKNDMLAIIGTNGSGKSSFLRSLLKFYKTEGEFTIDGNNIENIETSSLRSLISYVPQDCHIFNDSIFNNLAFSQIKPNEDEIYRLCKKYNYHEFFSNLQNGYETFAGENGKFLSGGQKQRINFMRAVIKGSPIMILDEPTSALDKASELELVSNLEILNNSGVTIIMIIHNLAVLEKFNKILYFSKENVKQFNSFSDYKLFENNIETNNFME